LRTRFSRMDNAELDDIVKPVVIMNRHIGPNSVQARLKVQDIGVQVRLFTYFS
jgi:hypothetical protein